MPHAMMPHAIVRHTLYFTVDLHLVNPIGQLFAALIVQFVDGKHPHVNHLFERQSRL